MRQCERNIRHDVRDTSAQYRITLGKLIWLAKNLEFSPIEQLRQDLIALKVG